MATKRPKTKRVILDLPSASACIDIRHYTHCGECIIFGTSDGTKVRVAPECGSIDEAVFEPEEIEEIVMSLRAARKLAQAGL